MCEEQLNIEMGKRIRLARTSRGLKRYEFAEMLGVSPSSITAYEKGEVLPPVVTVSAMANIFSVSMEWIIFGEPLCETDLEFIQMSIAEEENAKNDGQ